MHSWQGLALQLTNWASGQDQLIRKLADYEILQRASDFNRFWHGLIKRQKGCLIWNVDEILVRKPQGKKPFGWWSHRWEDNIRVDLRGIRYEGLYWQKITFSCGLCEDGNESLSSTRTENFFTSCISFQGRHWNYLWNSNTVLLCHI
jgi:hypothetical protein